MEETSKKPVAVNADEDVTKVVEHNKPEVKPEPKAAPKPEQKPKKKKSLWWLFLLIGIIVGGGGAFAAVMLLKDKDGDKKVEKSSSEVKHSPKDHSLAEPVEPVLSEDSALPEEAEEQEDEESWDEAGGEEPVYPGDYPETSEVLLSESDLEGFSEEELKIMRNEIYARHGYIFTTKDMVDYFSKQPWYNGTIKDAGEVYKTFSDIEKKNVDTIKKMEESAARAGNEWDALLDKYEKLVDKSISLSKKAKNGDTGAFVDAMSAASEAEELFLQINNASKELTSGQLQRLNKIQSKYLQGLQ